MNGSQMDIIDERREDNEQDPSTAGGGRVNRLHGSDRVRRVRRGGADADEHPGSAGHHPEQPCLSRHACGRQRSGGQRAALA